MSTVTVCELYDWAHTWDILKCFLKILDKKSVALNIIHDLLIYFSKELLEEDDSQTKKQLAEQLGVSQQVLSNRLQEMGKIQKTDR